MNVIVLKGYTKTHLGALYNRKKCVNISFISSETLVTLIGRTVPLI